jgi:hypothetical protein
MWITLWHRHCCLYRELYSSLLNSN